MFFWGRTYVCLHAQAGVYVQVCVCVRETVNMQVWGDSECAGVGRVCRWGGLGVQ